jgi:proline utilization trans-activator
MAYVRKMRELLALYSKQNVERLPDTQRRLRDNFIQDPYARTMVEGHGEEPEPNCSSYPQLATGHLNGQQPTTNGSSRLARLLELLPAEDETEKLVDQFFVHVHPNIMLFHRPSFQAMLDRLRMPETREIDAGWAVCFRVVVGLGCEWRPSSTAPEATGETRRLASIRQRLVNDSLSEMSQLMLSATLQSVTAMMLLAVYFTFANERNAAWILSGAAVRMGIGMGLHRGEDALRRSNIHLSTTDKELRKQVWSSLFIFEQYTSSLFGRPSAVDGMEMLIEVPKESVLDQGFYRPLGLLPYDISLARIIGKIREVQVDQSLSPSNSSDGLPDLDTCDGLLQELDNWKLSLPPFLRFDTMQQEQIYPSHFRQLVMLHVRYHYTRILLSRPFLLKALYVSHALRLSAAISDKILKFKDVCFGAATETWTLIMCLWDKGEYNACLWLDGVFAYQCNLVLSLYLLDPTRTVDELQHCKLQEMVQQMQQILVTGPGNKTMKRLVQISSDFTQIVGSLSPESSRFLHDEGSDRTPQDARFAQDGTAASNAAACSDSNGSTAVAGGENAAFFNWEFVVEPDLFFGNLMDDGSALDLLPGFGS